MPTYKIFLAVEKFSFNESLILNRKDGTVFEKIAESDRRSHRSGQQKGDHQPGNSHVQQEHEQNRSKRNRRRSK